MHQVRHCSLETTLCHCAENILSDIKLFSMQTAKTDLCKIQNIQKLVTFRNCPALCPAVLPKIIWCCQTANRGRKKCNMQYDGWCQFAKKNYPWFQKQKDNYISEEVQILCSFQNTHAFQQCFEILIWFAVNVFYLYLIFLFVFLHVTQLLIKQMKKVVPF